jgi:ferredoxin
MKVNVDREECIACGACWEDCPKVFEEAETDGLTQIAEAYRVKGELGVGQVPGELQACVQTAADGCPVEIIHVEE